jgi:hypothetical protein
MSPTFGFGMLLFIPQIMVLNPNPASFKDNAYRELSFLIVKIVSE